MGISSATELIPQRQADNLMDGARLEQLAFNERMAELGRLSAALLHELNTPMATMTLLADGRRAPRARSSGGRPPGSGASSHSSTPPSRTSHRRTRRCRMRTTSAP